MNKGGDQTRCFAAETSLQLLSSHTLLYIAIVDCNIYIDIGQFPTLWETLLDPPTSLDLLQMHTPRQDAPQIQCVFFWLFVTSSLLSQRPPLWHLVVNWSRKCLIRSSNFRMSIRITFYYDGFGLSVEFDWLTISLRFCGLYFMMRVFVYER